MTNKTAQTEPTIKTNAQSTFHRDGTVSYWDLYEQRWCRACTFDDRTLATFDDALRERIARHTRQAVAQLEYERSLADDEQAWA